jgi:hypothetical protein
MCGVEVNSLNIIGLEDSDQKERVHARFNHRIELKNRVCSSSRVDGEVNSTTIGLSSINIKQFSEDETIAAVGVMNLECKRRLKTHLLRRRTQET